VNSEPTDNSYTISILPMYRTSLGDALFPGDDYFTVKLRSDFSEMLVRHVDQGGTLTLTAIGAALSEFTPARVATTTHPTWKHREAEEWIQYERPRIFAAMESFFLDGGLERRIEEQRRFFAALSAAGVCLGNASYLFDRVVHAGDWRTTFIELAAFGRTYSIRLSGENIDRPTVAAAMGHAGFCKEQQQVVWSHIHEKKPLTTGLQLAVPNNWLRRALKRWHLAFCRTLLGRSCK
jgi:hypothetical protein